jgi:hypothetical protein
MLELNARDVIELIHGLLTSERAIRGKTGELGPMLTASRDQANDEMIRTLKKLELHHSTKVAQEMISGAKTIEGLHKAIEQLWNTVALELDGRKFYGPSAKYAGYYEQPKLFGEEVFNSFPSANYDIFEAGTCLALERGTASVMHLMRVAEVGLKVLANTLGVKPQDNWGSYLREIEKELVARIKTLGKHTPDEQFYAEASIAFDGVRRVWRNSTMHIDSKYSPERAEEILIAVRTIMRHLATRLNE